MLIRRLAETRLIRSITLIQITIATVRNDHDLEKFPEQSGVNHKTEIKSADKVNKNDLPLNHSIK